MYIVTVTSQGQISIPAPIRRRMGLDKTRRAMVSMVEEKMVMEPVVDIRKLKGIFKSSKKYTREEEREALAEAIANDFT